VRVPAFPEIVTFGETEAEAIEMAKEAIELVIESRTERGVPIASPDASFREITVSAVAA
jgi:antitoxin HicB